MVDCSVKKEMRKDPGDLQCEDANQQINIFHLVTKCQHSKVLDRTMNVHMTKFHMELRRFKCDIGVYSYMCSIMNHMWEEHEDWSFTVMSSYDMFLMIIDFYQLLRHNSGQPIWGVIFDLNFVWSKIKVHNLNFVW